MGSQSWKRHQPKMKIFALLSLFIFSAAQAQFFGVETGYNNTCLWEKEGLNREGPREFDCPRFVIESTDQIWNMYRDPELIKFYLRRYEKLEPLVLDTMIAFPDIKLHIVDTFCEGNDIDGYKTTMPVIHTATHLGWHSVFGEPTNKTLTWYGVPNCFIKNFDGQWKYTSEINMPDSLSLYSQMGVNPPEETWVMPTDDCNQLFDWDTGYINPKLVPFEIGNDA